MPEMEQTRMRNTKVCIQCHSRKIKCDLQERTDGSCRNCRKTNQICRPRLGVRQRAVKTSITSPRTKIDGPSPQVSSTGSVGYLGEESYLPNPRVPLYIDDSAAETADVHEKILQVTGATTLPSKILLSALVDVYFDHVHQHQAIVDRDDLDRYHSSPLLLQSLCMIGSAFGHRRAGVSQLSASNQFYLKVKALLDADHEQNPVVVLKALCLMNCRSAKLPTQICLESNWHWTGVAIRYAIHMGLHKEATYAGMEAGRAGSCRRMWWQLFNQDKMSSFCYGRPAAINIRATDVQLPSEQDFPTQHPDNSIFVQRTRLCLILGRLGDARYPPALPQEGIAAIGEALRDWVHDLPEHLGPVSATDTPPKPYRRVISELHILYFACSILYLQSLAKLDPSPSRARATLEECMGPASRISQLFEEVYYRNEASYLTPINNWYLLLAGIIQLRARATFPERRALQTETDDELGVVKMVLQEMSATVPSSKLILQNLDRIDRRTRIVSERSVVEGEKSHDTAATAAGQQEHGEDAVDHNTEGGSHPSSPSAAPCNGGGDGAIVNHPLANGNGSEYEVSIDNSLAQPMDNIAFDNVFGFDFGDIQIDAFFHDAWNFNSI